MDPSARLRQDQERQNRQRERDTYDRRHVIGSMRSRMRIQELTDRIEAAERKKRSDEAFEDMWAHWPKTRAALEGCTAIMPDAREKWLQRLEAIKNFGQSSAAEQLDDLAGQVNGVAGHLS